MSIHDATKLAMAISQQRPFPVRVRVGASLFDDIYELLKEAEDRTDRWMRFSNTGIDKPNWILMGIPAELDPSLPDAGFEFDNRKTM